MTGKDICSHLSSTWGSAQLFALLCNHTRVGCQDCKVWKKYAVFFLFRQQNRTELNNSIIPEGNDCAGLQVTFKKRTAQCVVTAAKDTAKRQNAMK